MVPSLRSYHILYEISLICAYKLTACNVKIWYTNPFFAKLGGGGLSAGYFSNLCDDCY